MKKKGFTLVELLAVIAILAILVIIALPNVLKMFNDAKKNSFITETKTIYSEVSKKYISETMKGNKLTYISSEDDIKLEMTGRDLQYCVLLNTDGSVKSMKVSNGEWIAELPSGKKITDLKSSDLEDGNLNDYDCYNPFRDDSWETIASNVKAGSTSNYHVGDEKEVDLGTYGTHKVRIANLNSPTKEGCGMEGFSESACGFVIEFADIIGTHMMNDTATNKDGWPASHMYSFLNDESNSDSLINALPNELKKVIIDTKTVSGHGPEDTNNFTSPDKLYLLAPKEIYSDWSNQYDTARDKTRQLDYYNSKGVTTNSYASAIKKNSEGTADWWLRCAGSSYNPAFWYVDGSGKWWTANARNAFGVSPAFRIG